MGEARVGVDNACNLNSPHPHLPPQGGKEFFWRTRSLDEIPFLTSVIQSVGGQPAQSYRSLNLKKFRELRMEEKGIAAVELSFILPMLLIIAFGIIDFGRLIQERLILTNISREGGSLASRGFTSGDNLLNMLLSSGTPLDLNGSGRIYVSRIRAGTSKDAPDPYIEEPQLSKGALSISSRIRSGISNLGLSEALYQHLKFKEPQNTSDIAELWVVEVYYEYKPITPLPKFITGILATPGYDGMIIGSKSVF